MLGITIMAFFRLVKLQVSHIIFLRLVLDMLIFTRRHKYLFYRPAQLRQIFQLLLNGCQGNIGGVEALHGKLFGIQQDKIMIFEMFIHLWRKVFQKRLIRNSTLSCTDRDQEVIPAKVPGDGQ